MNNEEFFVKQISNENNSLLFDLYLKKYFKDNPNESLKKAIVPKLNIINGINSQRNLQWIIDNDLISEINRENFSLKTLQQKNMVKFGCTGEINVWIPILVEKYNISLDMILIENIKDQYMNNELITMAINNYKIKEETQQLICERVFNLNNVEMARKWSKDLGLDYIPGSFQIRLCGVKGCLFVMPIKDFVEKISKSGKLRDIDGNIQDYESGDFNVILTDSMFKYKKPPLTNTFVC